MGEFKRRYREELAQPERQRLIDGLARMAREKSLTLLFGARDADHYQAVVILKALDNRFG